MAHGYEAGHEKETSFHVTIRVLLLGDIAAIASSVAIGAAGNARFFGGGFCF